MMQLAQRMSQLGIPTSAIVDQLREKNAAASGGRVKVGTEFITLDPTGGIDTVEDLEDLLISAGKTQQVYLRDVARVYRAYVDPPQNLLRYDGKVAIGLGISTVSGGNVVEMGAALQERIQELQSVTPLGVSAGLVSVQSEAVTIAIEGFVVSLVEAVAIVIVVLLFFMGLRSGLLIGFVLSDKVEASIYHTFQVYKLTFLERPIVIVLVILILLSIYAATRFRGGDTDLSETGVHAARDRGPQLAFFFVVLAFALTVLGDGLRWQFLTGVYPITASLLTLVFLAPLGVEMLRKKRASRCFYDSERSEFGDDADRRSNEHYLLWLAGMLAVSALTGFVIGIAGFIYAFMRVKARVPHWACALGAGAFVMLLGVLSHLLTLEYPQGLLQEFVTLPWPLQ